eukprot:CAMPEP_0170546252 /NCGR_PEP_ID=MMETSP0211-20121228/4627_1 /TAXON_ID=311385 /ORGANISM="Pseudokeronopsis sp., Strain OXSARD2" /LENGTH=64 /DNA_ID=CAMNT_0010850621 /DNA_START=302 /DNA_END=496 /DNA_ORIENTATION=-
MADDFVVQVTDFACKLAKHRGSDTLEKNDVKFAIEKLYNIQVPIKAQDLKLADNKDLKDGPSSN